MQTNETCANCAQEIARLRDELARTKTNLDRALRDARDGERENEALRRRLRVGGR